MALAALAAAVFAAPVPDADSDPYAHLKHDTICQGTEGSFVMTCVPAYFDGYMAHQCRSVCMAPGMNANCINLANAVHGDGSPKFTVVPYIAPDVTKLNNDTAECYRLAACSELHKYASCVQCLVNDPSTFKGTGVSKKDLVKEINDDLPQFEPFCQSWASTLPTTRSST